MEAQTGLPHDPQQPPPPPHCQYFIQLGSLITSRECQGDNAAECKAPSVGFLYDSRLPLASATDVTQDPAALSCCVLISLTLTVLVCSCFSCTPCKELLYNTSWSWISRWLELGDMSLGGIPHGVLSDPL